MHAADPFFVYQDIVCPKLACSFLKAWYQGNIDCFLSGNHYNVCSIYWFQYDKHVCSTDFVQEVHSHLQQLTVLVLSEIKMQVHYRHGRQHLIRF